MHLVSPHYLHRSVHLSLLINLSTYFSFSLLLQQFLMLIFTLHFAPISVAGVKSEVKSACRNAAQPYIAAQPYSVSGTCTFTNNSYSSFAAITNVLLTFSIFFCKPFNSPCSTNAVVPQLHIYSRTVLYSTQSVYNPHLQTLSPNCSMTSLYVCYSFPTTTLQLLAPYIFHLLQLSLTSILTVFIIQLPLVSFQLD